MKRKLLITIMAVLLAAIIPVSSWALSMPKDLLTYTVTITPSGGGQLYWNYGKNMEFFLCNGTDSYNQNCRVKKGESYRFSSVVDRAVIPKPDDGWYFDGFYDSTGARLLINPTSIDVIRITIDGQYYYDYVLSFDNAAYKNYTKKRYQDAAKRYVRSIYGTSRYKVMCTTQLYDVPKKSAELRPRFRKKALRGLDFPRDLDQVYDATSFTLWPDCPENADVSYKSSNARVLSVDKASGQSKIKAEGIATVTITLPETAEFLQETVKVRVCIKPVPASILSARRKDEKSLEVKWKPDAKCSGYEIQVGSDAGFSRITAKKTVASAKAGSAKITIPKKAVCKAVRIRAYKRSCGEKLYGDFDDCRL